MITAACTREATNGRWVVVCNKDWLYVLFLHNTVQMATAFKSCSGWKPTEYCPSGHSQATSWRRKFKQMQPMQSLKKWNTRYKISYMKYEYQIWLVCYLPYIKNQLVVLPSQNALTAENN